MLALPILRACEYRVHADEAQLDRAVRWAARIDAFDPAETEGDEILLADISALPADHGQLARTIGTFVGAGVSALFVCATSQPDARVDHLIVACREADLAVVVASKP